MAKNRRTETPSEAPSTDQSVRGPRKPREFRFEALDAEGTITTVDLVLTHKASAKLVRDFLNDLMSGLNQSETYRFTEIIIHA